LVKDIEIYEKVQRRATRVIEECKGKDYRERLRVVMDSLHWKEGYGQICWMSSRY
jgi:hypothetical protein